MANFFSSSGADDQRPDSSHLGGGDDFFSFKDAPLFKSDEKSGGSFFGDSSSSVSGGDHGNFFKPSGASNNEGSFLDFDGSSTEAEPTFLTPFSRTPPRKRQNQGPVSQPPLQHPAAVAKMDCSYASSPQLVKGDANSSLGRPGRSAVVPGLEPAPTAPSSNSQTFDGTLASPAQQNSKVQINAASHQSFNKVNSPSTCSTQQHGSGFSFDDQVGPAKELQRSSYGFDEHLQQSKEMSSSMMFESKHEVDVMSHVVGTEEKFQDTAVPMGRTGSSIGEVKSGGQPMVRRPTEAHVQGGHLVGEGQGFLQQLLVKQMQCIADLLAPELEKAMKKEEKMVKELEQVEQEGKAYRLQLEGLKERFGGRLGQISGFLGLNTKK